MKSRGFTIIELTVVISLIIIVTVATLVFVNPTTNLAKSRDNKRLSDLETLDRVINEYRIDNGAYPDALGILRTSTSLPAGATSLQSSSAGWIEENLSVYTSKLPTDPKNNATYYYSYKHDITSYEINAVLEYYVVKSQNDGGNDTGKYEIGNNLTII